MMLHAVPSWVQKLWPAYTWQVPTEQRTIYLSFDDGPVPEYTPYVLDSLRNAGQLKANFFCVGENVERYPDIFKAVLAAGHRVGNHTYNHLKGWQTPTDVYLKNVASCRESMERIAQQPLPKLFRPPYGRISREQAKALLPEYRIVMWSVLSVDYDRKLAPEKCLRNTLKASKPGSIVVFHDSAKAFKNLSWVLPRYLEEMQNRGYAFALLPWK